jgi:hypothetical protein
MRTRLGFALIVLLTLTACTTTASSGTVPATPTTSVATSVATSTTSPTASVALATATPPPTASPQPTVAASSSTARKTPPAAVLYDRAARDRDLAQLSGGEMRWQQAGIRSYRISVTEITTFIWQTDTITVQDGKVVDQSATCQRPLAGPSPCTVRAFNAEEITVPSLFAHARRVVNDTTEVATIESDARYGYPSRLDSNIPNAIDAWYSLRVIAFQPLP